MAKLLSLPARRAAVALAAGAFFVGVAGCKKEDAPVAAAGPAAPAAAAQPTYAFETVTFAYPAGWKVQPGPDGKGVIAVGPRDGDWEPNVALRTYANPEDKSVDALLAEGLEQVSRKPDFESKEKRSPIEHPAGLPYGRVAYLSKDDTTSQVSLAHWYGAVLLPDKRWMQVQASTAVETRDKYEPVFQALVDSMRVKK
jgi:hypothetical protein